MIKMDQKAYGQNFEYFLFSILFPDSFFYSQQFFTHVDFVSTNSICWWISAMDHISECDACCQLSIFNFSWVLHFRHGVQMIFSLPLRNVIWFFKKLFLELRIYFFRTKPRIFYHKFWKTLVSSLYSIHTNIEYWTLNMIHHSPSQDQ